MDVGFVSEGTIVGNLYRIDSYPGVVLNPNGSKVYGEILRLKRPDYQLKVLDEYEHAFPLIGADFDYRRVRTTATTNSADFECWVYEYAKPILGLKQIKSGRFNLQEP